MPKLYFDANASLPLRAERYGEIAALCEGAGNPSSVHQAGQRGRALIERARADILAALGLKGANLVFTSGATEANQLALWQAVAWASKANPSTRSHMIVSSIEHPSLLEAAWALSSQNLAEVTECPSTSAGLIDLAALEKNLRPQTKLVSLMLANNETGAIQPIKEAVKIVRRLAPHSLIHSDAVQALAKLECDYAGLDLDMLTFSGHKVGAFPGVGCLVFPKGRQADALQHGGSQEHYQRAGTEALQAIVSFGIAASKLGEMLSSNLTTVRQERDWIWSRLATEFPEITSTVQLADSLPNTLSLKVGAIAADDLIVALDLRGICVSSGAACSSGKPSPSHVLRAMGFSDAEARAVLRVSLPPQLTRLDSETFVREFSSALRAMGKGGQNVAA